MQPDGPRLVSVVVPARNARQTIAAQLAALSEQTYSGDWELVVADNRSTDRTLDVVRSFTRAVPSLTIVKADQRVGINHARNMGAAVARGELLAFCDGDDVATETWLERLVARSDEGDVVGGSLDYDALNSPRARSFCPWDFPAELPTAHEFLPYAPGGNCAVWANVARSLRWDESFSFGSSDIEFCWRAQLAGYTLGFAGDAVMQVRLKSTFVALARQYYRYGRSDPQLYRRFRVHGLPNPRWGDPLPSWRELLADREALRGLVLAPDGVGEPSRRTADWLRHGGRKLGRAVGSAEQGVSVW